MRQSACRIVLMAVVALASAGAGGQGVLAQAVAQPAAPALQPYVVEYYYKVKWGHFEEFLDLYMKNHYPILKKMQEEGTIVSMSAAYPRNHAGETNRWDMRFTIVYRDVLAEHRPTPDSMIDKLYPDKATFKKEEQRRFELLIEHMDIPIALDNLKEWK